MAGAFLPEGVIAKRTWGATPSVVSAIAADGAESEPALLEAIDELIEISRRSGSPAEIYHLKASGRENWDKLDAALARIEAARAEVR